MVSETHVPMQARTMGPVLGCLCIACLTSEYISVRVSSPHLRCPEREIARTTASLSELSSGSLWILDVLELARGRQRGVRRYSCRYHSADLRRIFIQQWPYSFQMWFSEILTVGWLSLVQGMTTSVRHKMSSSSHGGPESSIQRRLMLKTFFEIRVDGLAV